MSDALEWFKSSYSSDEGGECLETAYTWHKSSYSGSEIGSECVEVATHPSAIHIRDSKDTTQGMLTVSPATWTEFIAAL